MLRFRLFLGCFACAHALSAQTPLETTVPLQISAGLNPPAVFLQWNTPQPADILLRRRVKGAAGNTWITLVSASETLLNGHFDNGLDGSEVYEYALSRKTDNITAYGFGFANFFTPVVDNRGKLLVFIDSTTADALGADLITFKNDIRGEGWHTIPFKTGPSTTAQWVKNQIVAEYNADPIGVNAVLLMGNVPVPYSGSTAWDGKSDHIGAWPCDAFYGDVNGTWTDNAINLPNTTRLANRNVPNDGKFDQNTLPSEVELSVGRLDFSRLSSATFGQNPVELLRRYLWKNHLWRTGQYTVPKTALVDDQVGWANGNAYAADGYRNAYPLVGEANVATGSFLHPDRHLMRCGVAANATYSNASGIGSAAQFATDSVRTVFASVYGDYLGDWDFETDPLLPALLASKGSVLAVNWAGQPHWLMQGLATGETIGYCLKETQNAQFNNAYGFNNGTSGAHTALLGDPTLRAKIVAPPQNTTAVSNCDKVNLVWQASSDPEVLAYLVYRSFEQDGPYARATPDLIFQNSWEDLSPPAGTLFYSVRAVKLEVTPGGGAFYNASTGIPKRVVFVPGTGPTAIALGGTLNCDITSLTLGTNFNPPTSSVQWYDPNGDLLNGFAATEGGVYTVVVTAPNGCTTAAYASVNVDTLLPNVDFPSLVVLDCNNISAGPYIVPNAPPNIEYFYNNQPVIPGQSLTLVNNAVFRVHSTANGCSKNYTLSIQLDANAPLVQINYNGLSLNCNTNNAVLDGSMSSQNAALSWTQGVNGPILSTLPTLEVSSPGEYCLTATASNGCTSSDCVTVTQVADGVALDLAPSGNPCNNEAKTLQANASLGTAPYTYIWSDGSTSQILSLPAGFTGSVSVTVTDQNGCTATENFAASAPLDILVLSNEETSPGAANGYIDLLILSGAAPYTFMWSNGGTTEDIFGLSDGLYQVTVMSTNGCSAFFSIQLGTVVTQNPLSEMGVQITPNPANESCTVTFLSQAKHRVQIFLFSPNGQKVAEQSGEGVDFALNLRAFPSGIYQLWVVSGEQKAVFPLVIAR